MRRGSDLAFSLTLSSWWPCAGGADLACAEGPAGIRRDHALAASDRSRAPPSLCCSLGASLDSARRVRLALAAHRVFSLFRRLRASRRLSCTRSSACTRLQHHLAATVLFRYWPRAASTFPNFTRPLGATDALTRARHCALTSHFSSTSRSFRRRSCCARAHVVSASWSPSFSAGGPRCRGLPR